MGKILWYNDLMSSENLLANLGNETVKRFFFADLARKRFFYTFANLKRVGI